MKRFLIFCFYNKDGIADNYIFYFLDKIQPFVNEICIVVNGKITSFTEEGFKKYTNKILKRENKGFDSAAFKLAVEKLGFDYFKQFDEVIFANDTFYGPLFDLEDLFNKMENESDADFWGITKHPSIKAKVADKDITEHLQSYFLAYKKKILMSPDFEEYWNGVKIPTNYDEAVIFYELYTTAFFVNKGYKADAFIDINPDFSTKEWPYFYEVCNWVKEKHLPFIKKKIFEMDNNSLRNPIKNGVVNLLETIDKITDYDVNMIYCNINKSYFCNIPFNNKNSMFLQYIYLIFKRTLLPWKWHHYQKKLKAIRDKLDFVKILKNKKRILLVSHDLSFTGAPLVLLQIAQYLTRHNYIIDVVTFNNGVSHELYNHYKEIGITPQYIDNRSFSIEKFCFKNLKKYSLVICNTIVTYRFKKIAQRYKKPVVWLIHETKLLNDYIKNTKFKKVLVKSDNIYTVSEYAANIIKNYNSNIKIIPNGIQDKFETFYFNKNGITFGYIGSINKIKGIDILVDTFGKLVVKYPNAKLVVAGNNQVSTVIDTIQKCNNINWLGHVFGEAKTDFFKQIDVLCVPSIDDPCPLTLIEGCMYGKAIITTDKTGNNYMVKENESGFIIPANNTESLLNTMEYFCLNPEKIEMMQKESREMYLKYGMVENQQNKIDELLNTFNI